MSDKPTINVKVDAGEPWFWIFLAAIMVLLVQADLQEDRREAEVVVMNACIADGFSAWECVDKLHPGPEALVEVLGLGDPDD